MTTSKTFRNLSSALILVLVLGLGTVIFLWQNEAKKLKSKISVLMEKVETLKKNGEGHGSKDASTSILVTPVGFNSAKNAHTEYSKKWKAANITAFQYHEGFILDLNTMTEFKDKADTLYFNIGMRPKETNPDKNGNDTIVKFEDDLFSLYIYGIGQGKYIKNPKDTTQPMVYEYLKPCPHNCPVNSNLDYLITGVHRPVKP